MGRLRKKSWADDYLFKSEYVINNPEIIKDWNKEIFKNNNDLFVELGMGKGNFTIKQAELNLDKNIIGIEKFSSVQVIPVKLVEQNKLFNLKFISNDIKNIENWFKKNSISKLFINFPDPWPKKRHEKRRLLHKSFLNSFYNLLKFNSWIEFKTDQLFLFEFALDQIRNETKFEIRNEIRNLHNKKNDIIMTEYEKKFVNDNNPIYYVEFHKVVK